MWAGRREWCPYLVYGQTPRKTRSWVCKCLEQRVSSRNTTQSTAHELAVFCLLKYRTTILYVLIETTPASSIRVVTLNLQRGTRRASGLEFWRRKARPKQGTCCPQVVPCWRSNADRHATLGLNKNMLRPLVARTHGNKSDQPIGNPARSTVRDYC